MLLPGKPRSGLGAWPRLAPLAGEGQKREAWEVPT